MLKKKKINQSKENMGKKMGKDGTRLSPMLLLDIPLEP